MSGITKENPISGSLPVAKESKEPETRHRRHIIPPHMEKKLRDQRSSDESTKANALSHWHLSHNFRDERSFHTDEREKAKEVAKPFFDQS